MAWQEILQIIFSSLFLSGLLFVLLLCFLVAYKVGAKRNKYIKSLNEHDAKIISDYRAIDVSFKELFIRGSNDEH